MGAKLFAWAGGLAMFLGIVFFVKLSLERGWISDEVRIFIGLLVGAGLVVGGVGFAVGVNQAVSRKNAGLAQQCFYRALRFCKSCFTNILWCIYSAGRCLRF